MGLVQEFKDFAVKGNAIDLAVGVVIGAAFTKIVNSIVSDLIMPPIGILVGGVVFKDWIIPLKKADPAVAGSQDIGIRIGSFLNVVIEFLIIAIAVFIMIKVMNKLLAAKGSLVPGFVPGFGKKDKPAG